MTAVVELFFTYYNMLYEMIFGLITAIVEAGIVQAIVDSLWLSGMVLLPCLIT